MNRFERAGIGLLGCGVVGGGVVEALDRNQDKIYERAGRRAAIERIAVRDVTKPRSVRLAPELLCDDWRSVVAHPGTDVVVEAMGGVEPARVALLTALAAGKPVVTANKQLLALHGPELLATARANGATLHYEASVLAGIPAIHTLQTYFQANRVRRLRGIVNGTSNFILTRMDTGASFSAALAEAQALGYAEADPSQDVDGDDALYKLQILIWTLCGATLPETAIVKRGIRGLTERDVQRAAAQGKRWKLVAEAVFDAAGTPVSAAVEPLAVPPEDPLFHVGGVTNALTVEGDLVGEVTLMGPGAGALATASAIVEDLVKCLRTTALPAHSRGESVCDHPLGTTTVSV
ncbi:homoserine dehydrogenase [Alicyclobacillus kakegawensis]|uniref:homoserine dehydrogenase n=1 Tax=Alicyclobacillus kakegawensis TaxID=392012 RepID=UPI00082BC542|nr:homoserine dehydrogenase [Alicyclobacillus kakegawensis]